MYCTITFVYVKTDISCNCQDDGKCAQRLSLSLSSHNTFSCSPSHSGGCNFYPDFLHDDYLLSLYIPDCSANGDSRRTVRFVQGSFVLYVLQRFYEILVNKQAKECQPFLNIRIDIRRTIYHQLKTKGQLKLYNSWLLFPTKLQDLENNASPLL